MLYLGGEVLGETFYILKDGDLKRKDNNIVITSFEGATKNLKAEVTDEIYLFGETSLNTKLLNFVSQKGIIIHVFNYYGFYSGSFYPRESGLMLCLFFGICGKFCWIWWENLV